MDKAERMELLARLIGDTVAANREKGVYPALERVVEAVVFNEVGLTDAETGRIMLEDNELVDATYDALLANFDNDPEALMGAIGAAAFRADRKGMMPLLTGDQAFANLAASVGTNKDIEDAARKAIRMEFDRSVDALMGLNPLLKQLAPVVKILGAKLFDMCEEAGKDTTAEILDEIKALETLVENVENDLKDHTYNVVQLSALGSQYNSVADTVVTIRSFIGDIERSDMPDEEKLQKIADLYNHSEFGRLTTAMNGAYRCFSSTLNDIFENQNVFQAAYNRACEEVMFAGEALDLTVPYLIRQLNTYIAAYATMARVYEAQVAVYGEKAVLQSRAEMYERLSGCDMTGNKVQKSVVDLCADYFAGDRYIFVNKNNRTAIKFSKSLLFVMDIAHMCTNEKKQYYNCTTTPEYMKANPLNRDQMNAVIEYCRQKKVDMFDFLLNTLRMEPVMMMMETNSAGQREVVIRDTEWLKRNEGPYGIPYFDYRVFEGGKWYPTVWIEDTIYLATGSQEFGCKKEQNGSGLYAGSKYTYSIEGVKMNRPDATSGRRDLLMAYTVTSGTMTYWEYYDQVDLAFFQPR